MNAKFPILRLLPILKRIAFHHDILHQYIYFIYYYNAEKIRFYVVV